MMTLRDKIRIPLIFIGIILVFLSLGVAYPHIGKSHFAYRFGAGKDMNLPAAIPMETAPWLLGAGSAILVSAYVTREK
jgi:hypothetical protein